MDRRTVRALSAIAGGARADQIARQQGLLVGTSSGANVWAASFIARALGPTRSVVTVLPDRTERYFSTALI